jgi:hypothetical protein
MLPLVLIRWEHLQCLSRDQQPLQETSESNHCLLSVFDISNGCFWWSHEWLFIFRCVLLDKGNNSVLPISPITFKEDKVTPKWISKTDSAGFLVKAHRKVLQSTSRYYYYHKNRKREHSNQMWLSLGNTISILVISTCKCICPRRNLSVYFDLSHWLISYNQ